MFHIKFVHFTNQNTVLLTSSTENTVLENQFLSDFMLSPVTRELEQLSCQFLCCLERLKMAGLQVPVPQTATLLNSEAILQAKQQ